MFGIGLPELILILIVALLVVGPKKLPELARSLGKALHDVKSMTEDVKQSFVVDVDLGAPDNDDQKTARKAGTEPEIHEKDEKTGPDTAGHSPEKIKSDPCGNLRG
jgi:sec-independent protein translocase protein TatB